MVDLEHFTVHSEIHYSSVYQSLKSFDCCACQPVHFYLLHISSILLTESIMVMVRNVQKSYPCFQLEQYTTADLDTCLAFSSLEDHTWHSLVIHCNKMLSRSRCCRTLHVTFPRAMGSTSRCIAVCSGVPVQNKQVTFPDMLLASVGNHFEASNRPMRTSCFKRCKSWSR
jgi:hypothetical protein